MCGSSPLGLSVLSAIPHLKASYARGTWKGSPNTKRSLLFALPVFAPGWIFLLSSRTFTMRHKETPTMTEK